MKSSESQNVVHQVNPTPIFQPDFDFENVVSIDLDDIQEEVDYWNSAIVCAVLGANPPISVIEGFFRRIWKDLGVDKVVAIEHGVFLVRFLTMKNRDKVLAENRPTFDKKPVVCKPWHKDITNFREEVKVVPIWIQLKNLELKFWGNRSLGKIVSSIGRFIQADHATTRRDKLSFARVQIEIAIDQQLPACVKFHDEHGQMKNVQIGYEWRPIVCDHCKLLGHTLTACKKKKRQKKVWVAKSKSITRGTQVAAIEDGFVQANKTAQVRREENCVPVAVRNSFHMLEQEDLNYTDVDACANIHAGANGGGQPPGTHG
nr:uncharacterized protein LOC110799941 [Spinacia oleracea]